VLAFTDGEDRISIVNVDTGRGGLRTHPAGRVVQLVWSPDGSRLVALQRRRIDVYASDGRLVRTIRSPRGQFADAVAFAPRGRTFAYTSFAPERATVHLVDGSSSRTVFSGAGRFDGLVWSPDGRWLAVGWPAADQWVFVRVPTVRKVVTVSEVSRVLDPGDRGASGFARILGWCCPS
jgi:Tol biopolymer transport system component